jgi:hypothetical protein
LWNAQSICANVADIKASAIVCLLVAVRDRSGNVQTAAHTGFLYVHRGILCWVTAGHVVEHLDNIRESKELDILRLEWLDASKKPEHPAIPLTSEELGGRFIYADGWDIGFLPIPAVRSNLIMAGNETMWVHARELQDSGPDTAKGRHYLVGFPHEYTDSKDIPGGISTRVSWVGLPVRQLQYVDVTKLVPGDRVPEFARNEQAFYGQIVDFAGGQPMPQSIKGMSGGLIFRPFRDGDKSTLRIVAVQSAWDSPTRVIRATPVPVVPAMVERWWKQLQSA